jgi:hypothetical protein
MCQTTRDSLGSPRCLARSCFHLRAVDLLRSTVPSGSFTIPSSSSLAFASSELLRLYSSLIAFRRELHLPGFSALFATSPARSHVHRDDSHRRRFVPSPGFLSLSTVCSALGLAGLFHPAATSRVLPFRGFSPRAATLPHRKELPPCRRSDACSPTFAGCRPHRTSASRSSSARGRVRCNAVIHHAARRSPPRFPLLQALTPSVDRSLPAISAHDVRSPRLRCSRSRAELVLSVSPEEARRCVSAPPACSSFRAFLQTSVRVTPSDRKLPCDLSVRDALLSAWLPSR